MQFRYERDEGDWICLLNPYGDAWYPFGRGKTKHLAKVDAIGQWNLYNRFTDSNY